MQEQSGRRGLAAVEYGWWWGREAVGVSGRTSAARVGEWLAPHAGLARLRAECPETPTASRPVSLVGVQDLDEARACFEPLARLDYIYAPNLPEEMHWFCKPDPSHRTHHLHLVPVDSHRYRDELAFRDRLRADSKLAERYAALKARTGRRASDDREACTNGKSAFIASALQFRGSFQTPSV